jgi:3-oxoacyl-[acyl-carrier protein] reductase
VDLKITGKTALVLAAGGGLGGAIALALAEEGANVVVADIDLDAALVTVKRIEAAGGQAMPLQLDLGNLSSFEMCLAEVHDHYGDVEILVNITGGPPPTTAAGVSPDVWRKHFESMVLGVIRLTDLLLPAMREKGWGRVVTSTSSGIAAPIPNLAISNALRLSIVGWSKTLAGEVGRDGVTVNMVVPGRIATQRIRALDDARAKRERRSIEDVVQASTNSIPLGRYGEPREYGAAVAFLASEAASYITGSTLRVDGGLIPAI